MTPSIDKPIPKAPKSIKPVRIKLPDERFGVTTAVDIGGFRVRLTPGLYPDGTLGEFFIKIGKPGNAMAVYDMVAIAVSIGLQYGIPLKVFTDKFRRQQMEPSGVTSNPGMPIARSIIDFVAWFLDNKYGGK